ncbi:MAG: AraC family ligand binding domain-containing protein, partial [Anaerostipes sp.]
GYSTTAPLHSFGPAVRPHYLIHFILNGKGIFQKGDKTYHLETGQGFFIEPDELTFTKLMQKNHGNIYGLDLTERWFLNY